MENVINKLSEIEATASKIIEDVSIQKKALAAELEENEKAYDEEMNKKTEAQLAVIQKDLEKQMDSDLSQLRQQTDEVMQNMDTYYRENHETLSASIFNKLVRM